ncbi:DUF2752 domain-containing protein [Clostridium cellulovorans]
METIMHKNINNLTPNKIAILRISLLVLPIISIFIFYLLRYYIFSVVKLLPQCTFYEKTSLLCPGCGMTRSILALFRGDILNCLKSNVATMLIVIFGFLKYLELLALSFNKKLFLLPRYPSFYWLGLTLLILYWILRNIEFFLFLKP